MRRIRIATATCLFIATCATAATGRASSLDPTRIEPGLLDATAPVGVLARFERAIPDLAGIDGLRVGYRFGSVPAVAATATPAALRALAADPTLAYLEAAKPLAFDLDSAVRASRAREVHDGSAGIEMPGGGTVDGAGVGIAIVDSGLDMLHPDFQAPGKVGGNYQVTPAGVLEQSLPWTSYISGHGTHVAGIATGNGLSSEGLYRGVAPGSTLYAFDMYTGNQQLAAIAFDWILQNGADQDPPIRIVNNSWHCSAASCNEAFNPDQLHVRLATDMANAGIVVTWAAGNHDTDVGNDGFASSTNLEAHNQTPGIISVANYNDEVSPAQVGVRTGCLASGSSRGASDQPQTWPDLAAPGSSVYSTWAVSPQVDAEDKEVETRNPVDGSFTYRRLSGTSMAAPHVAGIVAMMLQLRPDLEPADVEYILKATTDPLGHCAYDYDGRSTTPPTPTTYVRADETHPWGGTNYADGHGLVDAVEALSLAATFAGIPAPVATEPIPQAFVRARPGIQATETLYFTRDGALAPAFPHAPAPRVAAMPPGQAMTFTSEPLAAPVTAEAIAADVFLGTTGEAVAKLNPPRIRLTIFDVPPDGDPTLVATDDESLWQIHPALPTQRDFRFFLPEPVTFAAGHAVRVRVSVISPDVAAVPPLAAPAPYAFWTLYWESATSSRVVLGSVVDRPEPSSRAWCEARQDCADLDETHMLETMTCSKTPVSLTWDGPPGSSLVYTCGGHVATCAIPPTEPAETGHCETEFELAHVVVYKGGTCSYHIPGGARGGKGRCVLTQLTEEDD